ncbi:MULTISPECIES: helix-turn-helix domain-containing protein [Helcococcus]|uniref:Helix-turn-helix domain-containing protein n=1 Tax=Helcococcus bovis TaxID=3153252 RepID=A0ABW9F7Z3_9FIRM
MNDKQIIKEYIIHKNTTQTALASQLGYKNQSGIGNILMNKNAVRADILFNIINALGGEIIIRDKESGRVWELEYKSK